VASTTKPYAIPAVCTMPNCESLLCVAARNNKRPDAQ
jgi:hypothetical protein